MFRIFTVMLTSVAVAALGTAGLDAHVARSRFYRVDVTSFDFLELSG